MYFQIGAHPAFYFPKFDAATKDRGFFVFDRKSDLEYIMPIEKGCVSPERHVLKLNKEGLMPIDIHTFDCDTYIFDAIVDKIAYYCNLISQKIIMSNSLNLMLRFLVAGFVILLILVWVV